MARKSRHDYDVINTRSGKRILLFSDWAEAALELRTDASKEYRPFLREALWTCQSGPPIDALPSSKPEVFITLRIPCKVSMRRAIEIWESAYRHFRTDVGQTDWAYAEKIRRYVDHKVDDIERGATWGGKTGTAAIKKLRAAAKKSVRALPRKLIQQVCNEAVSENAALRHAAKENQYVAAFQYIEKQRADGVPAKTAIYKALHIIKTSRPTQNHLRQRYYAWRRAIKSVRYRSRR